MTSKFFQLIIIISAISCRQIHSENKSTLADSLVKRHLVLTSSFQYYDTQSYDRIILGAYLHNDTNQLKKLIYQLEGIKNVIKNENIINKKRSIENLKNINPDEGYQFLYNKTFCDKSYVVTIYRTANTYKFNYMVFQSITFDKDSLVENETKKITEEDWNNFKAKVSYADLWSLSQNIEQIGFDGDFLSVEAIKKLKDFVGQQNNHLLIKRRFVGNTALYDCFDYLLKYNGKKNKCF